MLAHLAIGWQKAANESNGPDVTLRKKPSNSTSTAGRPLSQLNTHFLAASCFPSSRGKVGEAAGVTAIHSDAACGSGRGNMWIMSFLLMKTCQIKISHSLLFTLS